MVKTFIALILFSSIALSQHFTTAQDTTALPITNLYEGRLIDISSIVYQFTRGGWYKIQTYQVVSKDSLPSPTVLTTPTSIAGQSVVGNGMPVIVYKSDSTGVTAKNMSATTMFTPSNAVHHFEVSAYLRCSTLGSSSTWTVQVGFTDGSAVTYNWPTAATTATGVFLFAPMTFKTSNNTAITYKVVVSGTAPVVSYSVYLKMLD